MPSITVYNLNPNQTSIAVGARKTIKAGLQVQSNRQFTVVFSLAEANSFVFLFKNPEGQLVEGKRIEFPGNAGSILDVPFSRDLTITRKGADDDSIAIFITAQVRDNLPSSSIKIPRRLNVS